MATCVQRPLVLGELSVAPASHNRNFQGQKRRWSKVPQPEQEEDPRHLRFNGSHLQSFRCPPPETPPDLLELDTPLRDLGGRPHTGLPETRPRPCRAHSGTCRARAACSVRANSLLNSRPRLSESDPLSRRGPDTKAGPLSPFPPLRASHPEVGSWSYRRGNRPELLYGTTQCRALGGMRAPRTGALKFASAGGPARSPPCRPGVGLSPATRNWTTQGTPMLPCRRRPPAPDPLPRLVASTLWWRSRTRATAPRACSRRCR